MTTNQAPSPGSKRHTILTAYAEWTVLSALRNGPIRSAKKVYAAIRDVGLAESPVLRAESGKIERDEFDKWHAKTIRRLVKDNPKLNRQFGWAAKIINVYLKTFAYVGDGGRPGLRECLHPPIDSGLWDGVKRRFKKTRPDIVANTHIRERIREIDAHDVYRHIIKGLRAAADAEGCILIEIEYLWENIKPLRS